MAKDVISIELSQAEYNAIASALGETLEALEDWEFQTRTGTTPDFVRQLLREFREADPAPALD
jgi:hypothetical protein